MPRLMMKCPKTGKEFSTGVSMDEASFNSPTNVVANNTAGCPHCKGSHTWSKKDVYLEKK